MRIQKIEIAGFRGFAGRQAFDVDADTVILVGANGHGKTSVLDAVLWALAGSVPRLGNPSPVTSLYSETGEAHVSLELKGPSGNLSVSRSLSGTDMVVTTEVGARVRRGAGAEAELLEALWPSGAAAGHGSELFAKALVGCVYLQQDVVRQFIEATDADRFAEVSDLIGAGRIADLQGELERAKLAWSKATNLKSQEAQVSRRRVDDLQTQVRSLEAGMASGSSILDETVWNKWWSAAVASGASPRAQASMSSSDSAQALDVALKELEALQRAEERRAGRIRALGDGALLPAEDDQGAADTELIRQRVAALKTDLNVSWSTLAVAQQMATEQRKQQALLRDQAEELRTLAELAIRHIDGPCPVCAQIHNVGETRTRLRARIEQAGTQSGPIEGETVNVLVERVAEVEKELAAHQAQLARAEAMLRSRAAEREEWRRKLREFEITDGGDVRQQLAALVDSSERRLADLASLRREGEVVNLQLARSGESARLVELRQGVVSANATYEAMQADVKEREATGELGQKIIEALREASSEVVTDRLKEIGPMLQRIYAKIDPHPALKVVNFVTQVHRGKGRLTTTMNDPGADKTSESPTTVLSSAQINALALAVFM